MSTITSKTPVPLLTVPSVQGAVDARAVGVMTLLCLIWSLQQVSLKAVAQQASPMLMVALRSSIAVLLLLGLMRHRAEHANRARWRPGAVAGALFGLEYLLVSQALLWTHASHVVVFLYTAPIFAAIGLQARVPHERLTSAHWCGIALAFAGIAVAFLGSGREQALVGNRALLGDGLALLAGVSWGATTVVIRSSALSAAPASETLLYQLLGAVLVLLPVAALGGNTRIEFTPTVWIHLAFQSLVVSFASFLTWCWLLRRYLASQLGVFSFLTPLIGVLLSACLLNETLDNAFLGGGSLVLAGIALVSARTLRYPPGL